MDSHCWEMNAFMACLPGKGTHLSLYNSRTREDEQAQMGDRGTLRVVKEDRQGTDTERRERFPVETPKSSPEAPTVVLILLRWLVDLQF